MTENVVFTAEWCGPCDQLKQSDKFAQANVEVVDVEEENRMANEYGVRSVPTLVTIEDDKPKKQVSGIQPILDELD